MTPHLIYLHGFASGPGSRKAAFLRERLAGRYDAFAVPALDGDDFTHQTIPSCLDRAVSAIAGLPGSSPVVAVASSLGGYVAALALAQGRMPSRLKSLVLLAPAFGFATRWRNLLGEAEIARWRREGFRSFHHAPSGQPQPLAVAFLDSCQDLPEIPAPPADLPVAILHGRRDQDVDWQRSFDYCQRCPGAEYHLLDAAHGLDDPVHYAWMASCAGTFLDRLRSQA